MNALKEYLKRHGIKQKDFAHRLNPPRKPQKINAYCRGRALPGPEMCLEIFRATNGEVTPAMLRPDYAEIFAKEILTAATNDRQN